MRKIESKWNTMATVWIHFLTLPVSRGVLSTQYPISPANSSVAPPEENPYTAGSWRESGDRLMRNSPTPKDHIRSPCQTGGNKADTDIESWHQNCLCVCVCVCVVCLVFFSFLNYYFLGFFFLERGRCGVILNAV